MTVTRKVYFDWTVTDTWVDMSDYVVSVSGTIGWADWKSRVADVGICTIELKNDLRYFSPENVASPYYGQMVPNIPVKVEITDDTGLHRVFTVWATDFEPQPGQYESQRSMVICQDRIGQLQDADLSLPIQLDQKPGDILRRLTSTVYESGQATGTVYMRQVVHSDTLVVGARNYIFEDALTPLANEIALETQDYFFDTGLGGGGITDSAVNAAAAINRDEGSGTDYAAATERHLNVTAVGTAGLGLDESDYDTDYDLQRTGTAYEALAASFSWRFLDTADEPVTLPMRRVYLYLKKVGSPTGTLSLRHEIPTGAGGSPSGTLYNASGTATNDEADLTTAFAWVPFDVAAEYDMENYSIPAVSQLHWLVLSTDRATDAANYVVWGGVAASPSARFSYDTKTGGAWAGRDFTGPLIFIPGLLDITASAHGAWGNDIGLDGQTADYHLDADPTINDGAIISGSYLDTLVQDGTSLVLAEVPGSPGFDYEFEFNINGTGLTAGCYVRYQGGSGHIVTFDAWNGVDWDTLATITDNANFEFVGFSLDAAHTIGGVVTIRTYHAHNGNSSHILYIDHCDCASDTPDGITTMELSASALTGGVDGPVGAMDIEDGQLTMTYAGDTWVEGDTNALTGAADLAFSEYGLLWASRSGDVVFKNHSFEFKQRNSTPEMTCDDAHTKQTGGMHKADIINRVTLSYEPRATLASAVLAKSPAPIFLGGVTRRGRARWNAYDVGDTTKKITNIPGEKTVVLPYKVDETSTLVGGLSIEQPLVPETDYEIWRRKNKSGGNPTTKGFIKFAIALVASGIQVQMRNTTGRSWWVHDLQVRGTGLYRQDTTQIIVEDAASRSDYGLRLYQYSFPFPSDTVETFAEVLGWHFINRFKSPMFNIISIGFRGVKTVGGVSVFDLDIGDVIALSETQTAISDVRIMITGIELILPENDVHEITFFVTRLNDDTYWELGVAGRSELGVTTLLTI